MTGTAVAVAGLAAILGALTLAWVVSVQRRDASLVDICWGPGFVLLAWLYPSLAGGAGPRSLLMATLVTVWGTRLAAHIAWRHRHEDPRYTAIRRRHGEAFWWRSLFIVFWLQAVILWFVELPLLVAAMERPPSGLTATDVAGTALFAIGFAFEAIGDLQLARFRADPANHGLVLETGLWRFTRHPNYFGDATLWWGLYVIAGAAPGGWLTVLSPALMTFLLMRVSGVTLLEDGLKASKPGYRAYIARTPSFFPWFPRAPK